MGSILDEWERGGSIADITGGDSVTEPFEIIEASEAPIFAMDRVDRQIARGRGQVVAVAAANECIVVATSRGYIIRYDMSEGATPVTEIELAKGAVTVRHLFLDPSACSTLISLQVGGVAAWETYYLHAHSQKARLLSKLRDVHISAVGWDAEVAGDSTTGDVLVGTEAGTLHVFRQEEKEKKERLWAPLLQLDGGDSMPVRGCHYQVLSGENLLVLAATPTRLFLFLGGPGLKGLFSGYASRSLELNNFVEQPCERQDSVVSGMLALHTGLGLSTADRFAWLSEAGPYSGRLNSEPDTDRQQSAAVDGSTAVGDAAELSFLEDCAAVGVPHDTTSLAAPPLSMAVTEFHILLLFPTRLLVLNAVSRALVQDIALAGRGAPGYAGQPLSLIRDPATSALYLATSDGLAEMSVQGEGRDMWRVHLKRGAYQAAIRAASTQGQRNVVNIAEADAALEVGDTKRAARLYGRVTAALPSFEEVALKFVDSRDTNALQIFLLTKLQVLGSEDKAQATLVASWLTELYLDQINRALLEEGTSTPASATDPPSPSAEKLGTQLQSFLATHVEVLDPGLTTTLLGSYGRLDDLVYYATLRQDSESVVEALVERGQANAALAVLRRPGVSQELSTKFAPALLAIAPAETVDAWMSSQPPMDPRRFLPALLRFGEAGSQAIWQGEALRYIEFCLHHLQSQDAAVHRLAVALYSLQDDEAPLLRYLAAARGSLGEPLYDVHNALRLCCGRGRIKAAVALLVEVGSHEDALALALATDMSLAAAVASRPEDDRLKQRHLWLAIARHVISQPASEGQNSQKVNELLRDSGGLVKIEDILPLFPDFAQVDSFKEAICKSLSEYNEQIENLKTEMADATQIADALRRDMAALDQRGATLDLSELCAVCREPLSTRPPASAGPSGGAMPPFYLFPSGNAFHGACLSHCVAATAVPAQKTRIEYLQNTLASAAEAREAGESVMLEDGSSVSLVAAITQLDDLVASEDPHSGDCVVYVLQEPFLLPGEAADIDSWRL